MQSDNTVLLGNMNLRIDICEGQTRSSFPVNNTSQSGFSFNYAVWYSHLSAQGW